MIQIIYLHVTRRGFRQLKIQYASVCLGGHSSIPKSQQVGDLLSYHITFHLNLAICKKNILIRFLTGKEKKLFKHNRKTLTLEIHG